MSGGNSGRNILYIVVVGVLVLVGDLLIGSYIAHQSGISSPPNSSLVSHKPRVVRTPDYRVVFKAARHTGPVGKISVPDDGNTYCLNLLRVGTRQWISLRTQHGVATAPIGKYQLVFYIVQPAHNRGYGVEGRLKSAKITVIANSTTKLKLGGPYTAQVSVRKLGGDKVSINLTATDCAGNQCSIDGPKNPRFQVVSKSGEVLQEGSFQYG